jgi:4-hydroxy-4-methyl-2-oxoglutarate aldolase
MKNERSKRMGSNNFSRPSRELVAAFAALPTTNISDALDRLRIRGGCEGILPLVPKSKLCGPAFTVRYRPVRGPSAGVGDYIDDCQAGDVVVLDNGGRTYCTVWGDLLTLVAVRDKLAGTVIDGVCRDVHRIYELNYPMFTRGHFMVTGKDRVEVAEINGPVNIANIQVHPGDLMVGDGSGLVIVPLNRAEEVLANAREVAAAEEGIEKEIAKGSKLVEARKRFRYEDLQRPKDKGKK